MMLKVVPAAISMQMGWQHCHQSTTTMLIHPLPTLNTALMAAVGHQPDMSITVSGF